MAKNKHICVFCGANGGKTPDYIETAKETGRYIAEQGHTLVYGAGSIGMMGAVAEGALSAGGKVIGVIPDFLVAKELAYLGLTECIEVATMHQRKQKMADLADGFIALPGGMGTMDELCEIITWAQLGLHQKPIGLLNFNGYFDLWIQFMNHMTQERFFSPENRKLVLSAPSIAQLLEEMEAYRAPKEVHKWLDRSRT